MICDLVISHLILTLDPEIESEKKNKNEKRKKIE